MELKNIIDEILNKVKISEIIGKYIDIKQKGSNYFALCPFHNEKTPSFSINDEKKIFKCFGCGKTGNAITFLMEYKGLNFNQALREIATYANIDLGKIGFNKFKKHMELKEKIAEINNKIAYEYYQSLIKNEKALKYVKEERKINSETINRFIIGYAPEYDIISNKFKGVKDLIETGAVYTKNGKTIDRFKNKIIFPIFDIDNSIIAFGSRVLDDSKPKYVNSPETKIFKKRQTLYGLNFAIESLKETRSIYIVEGYFDLIMMHQAGIKNSVATLGTALSSEHIKTLKKYVDKIILLFDGDEAGYKATVNGIKTCVENDIDSYVVILPYGLDPFDFIVQRGIDELRDLLNNKVIRWEDFLIEPIIKTNAVIEKKKRVIEILNMIKDINEITKSMIIKKISDITGISKEKMNDYIKKASGKGKEKTIKKEEKNDPIKDSELELISILINNPQLYLENNDKINETIFEDDKTLQIFQHFKTSFLDGIFRLEIFISLLGELKDIIEKKIGEKRYTIDPEKQLKDTYTFLRIMKIKKRKEIIKYKIKNIDSKDEESLRKLNYELYLLSKEENEIKKKSNLLSF